MSPFIETIRLLDGELTNLKFHQLRFERTRTEVLGLKVHPLLAQSIPVPQELGEGVFKCRVIYSREIERFEFEPYIPVPVRSLKLVYSDIVSYGYKSSDRTMLNALYRERGTCDDVLIVKGGCITDSYNANVAFFDGVRWCTPDTPLLPGTMRALLIGQGILFERRIGPGDISKYSGVKLINAMNPLNDSPEIKIEDVK
jgi:4-amino-4-deoxychorismate lyase